MAILLSTFSIVDIRAEEARPQFITLTEGRGIGNHYINVRYSGYPFLFTFDLTEENMPRKSAKLGISAYDCDWDATFRPREYDMVFVNDVNVGTLTGRNDEWNTSYFSVPLTALKVGTNQIVIHVGEQDLITGKVIMDSHYWRLTVNRATLQFDEGKSDNAPESFTIVLDSAEVKENGITCSARATIQSSSEKAYVIEYSLIDKYSGSSSLDQMVASDLESVQGTNITSVGYFVLPPDAHRGDYLIQATLRDQVTNEALAYAEKTFNLDKALETICHHVRRDANDTFLRTAIRQIPSDSPRRKYFDSDHETRDLYTNTCRICSKTYTIYNRPWELEEHTPGLCICGYLEPGYDPIKSATFAPLGESMVNHEFIITVVVDSTVKRITATNDWGFPLKEEWIKHFNSDGTVTWSRIYMADMYTAPQEQVWEISCYSATGRKLTTRETNGVIIHPNTSGKRIRTLNDVVNEKEFYTIHVVDSETGWRIPDAYVTLSGYATITDENGTAYFKKLETDKGDGGITVRKSGYPDYHNPYYDIKKEMIHSLYGFMDTVFLVKDQKRFQLRNKETEALKAKGIEDRWIKLYLALQGLEAKDVFGKYDFAVEYIDDRNIAEITFYGMTQTENVLKATIRSIISSGKITSETVADEYMRDKEKVNRVLKGIIDEMSGTKTTGYAADAVKITKDVKALERLALDMFGEPLTKLEDLMKLTEIHEHMAADYSNSLNILESLKYIAIDNPALNDVVDDLIISYKTWFSEEFIKKELWSLTKKAYDYFAKGSPLTTADLFLKVAFNNIPTLNGLDKVITIHSFLYDINDQYKVMHNKIKSGNFSNEDAENYMLIFDLNRRTIQTMYREMMKSYNYWTDPVGDYLYSAYDELEILEYSLGLI